MSANYLWSKVFTFVFDRDLISDAVQAVCIPVKDDPVCVNVRRSHLLRDALKECKKARFDPEKTLLVSIFLCSNT